MRILRNSLKGQLKTKNGWSIAWHDEDGGIVYHVLILSASGKNPFTKEDLMMVANSMR